MDHPDLRQDQPCLHHPQPLLTYTEQLEEPAASAKDTAFLGIRAVLEKLSGAKGTGQAQHTPPSIKPMHYFFSPCKFVLAATELGESTTEMKKNHHLGHVVANCCSSKLFSSLPGH